MFRCFGPLVVAVWIITWTGLSRAGEENADLKQALALQKVMQKAILDVEPAIACILVSRSDVYQRFSQAPPADQPGKLGGFDPSMLGKEERIVRKKMDLADPANVPESFGSGVVIDARKGLILTNFHVVRDATKIFVRLPGDKKSYADIHAADPRSDLAVLRLLTPNLGLKTIPLGDAGKCARGQFVLSIANPYAAGFRDGQPSASWGILSNVRRRAPGNPREDARTKTLHHYGTLLQTDARLNLGCSGGALINLQGEMIGLSTALAAIHGGETPGGYAVPIDAGMLRIIEVLKRGEEVDYGFLGVALDEVQAAGAGVVLAAVTPGSPAQREGRLRMNDAILEVNGTKLRDSDDLFLALGTHLAGSRVKLKVRRGGVTEAVEVTLAKFYVPGKKIASSLGSRPFFRGLRVDYTSLLVLKMPRDTPILPGVMISEIRADGPAAAQLKVGEIITQVNGRAVNRPEDFYRAVKGLAGPAELTLASFAHDLPPKIILK